MSLPADKDNEKNNILKSASESISYDYFGDGEMESAESTEPGEFLLSGSVSSPDEVPVVSEISFHESEVSMVEKPTTASYEERKKELLIKEKWMSVTGRKPKNVPVVRKFRTEEEEFEKIVLFGDRRPFEVEKQRKERWMKAAVAQSQRTVELNNYGKIRSEVRLPSVAEGVTCIRFEPNGESLTTAYRRGGVQVRETFTGELICTLKPLEMLEKLPVRALRYHPVSRDKLYIAGGAGIVQAYNIETAEMVGASERVDHVNNLDITSNGQMIVTAGRDGKVVLFDVSTLQVISTRQRHLVDNTATSAMEFEYHKLRLYGLKCHPLEANLFVSGGWDRTVKIWDVRVPGAIHSIKGPFISGSGIDIQGNKFLTASWVVEDSLKIWDFSSRKLLDTIPIKTKSTIYEGEFLYSGVFLNYSFRNHATTGSLVAVGGSGFNEACIIDINTKNIIASFPTYKAIITLDTLGNFLAYGGRESLFRICEVVFP